MKKYVLIILAMYMSLGIFPSLSNAKTVVVGVYENEPLIFTDTDQKIKGVFADILQYVAEKEGWQLEYRQGSWPEGLERLESGEIDLLVAIAFSEERQRKYDFTTESILANWGVVYTRAYFELLSTLELTDRKMAVVTGDIYYTFFKELSEKFQISPHFVEVGSYPEVLELLDARLVDAGILPRIYGSYHEAGHQIQKSSMSFRPISLHIAAPKNRSNELLEAIDRHLKPLKEDKNSFYYRSINTWIEGVHRLAFPKWLRPIWVLSFLAIFITIILLGIVILRWQVRVQAKALAETLSAKEKIESELRIAHEIQMESVPTIFPAFPERQEFDIHAVLEPAREVGGDFYDFFFIDKNQLCFVIGDVSGKGVPAALFMSAVKTLTKATAKHAHTPGALLAAVNQELAPENESCTFVTVFCGILDIHTGEVCYTNAGHNPPLLLHQNDIAEFIPGTHSTVVGIDEDAEFHELTLKLRPGECICLYTDGVTEAFNPEQDMFSEERLQQEIRRFPKNSMQTLVNTILERVQNFAGDMPQTDDITILALRYLGNEKI